MKAADIRQKFLDFFESKSHEIVSSAPIVVKNDPSLMFNNAGMNQFKDCFLGNTAPSSPRIANTQKCLRVSGKHNDLEEVGVDTYHHTMFEMLGNWSFGDYFKKEAIEWAWELLTKEYKLSEEKLYVTIFEGDKEDGLSEDSEAFELWNKIIPAERIIKCDKKDNFWEMGEQGPCGPCSEIHIDLRDDNDIAKIPGRDMVNQDHPLVIEIWNLVFMQYNRKADGSLIELPSKHIDTGMGFERLALAIQNKKSNYDTDVFQPLIQFIAEQADVDYGEDEKIDIAIRVMADHIRAISFTIADGQLPSNNGAGYVIRRILRRAVRYGYTFLNIDAPFLYLLVDILAEQFENVFPSVVAQQDFIKNVVKEEEATFLRTLTSGIKKLDQIIELSKKSSDTKISGKVVFELYDTFGFPTDLTALIARENGLEIDEEGFQKAMLEQKERSRSAAAQETSDWTDIMTHSSVEFVGYDETQKTTKLVKYRKIKEKKKDFYQLVLAETPFYPEGGGQVGDTGSLDFGGEKIFVFDTKRENDLIIHLTHDLPTNLTAPVEAHINTRKRKLSANNHTSTHLLQSALKEVLGDHIAQKGSLVNDKVLRFDFSHFAKLTEEEIAKVEDIVNSKIHENIVLDEKRNIPIDDALKLGATALFGEKYGDTVRVITFDPEYSVELCGGTHVPSTAQIGIFKIVSESSVAAGVRRIEAVTSEEASQFINNKLNKLNGIEELLKHPKDVLTSVHNLLDERARLTKKIEELQQGSVKNLKEDLIAKIENKDGVSVLIDQIKIDSADSLKKLSFDIKNKVDNLFMVLAADIDSKPQISVVVSESLVKDKDLNAGKIVKELAAEIKGGGGGQPFFATAGGKDVSGLGKVVEKAKTLV